MISRWERFESTRLTSSNESRLISNKKPNQSPIFRTEHDLITHSSVWRIWKKDMSRYIFISVQRRRTNECAINDFYLLFSSTRKLDWPTMIEWNFHLLSAQANGLSSVIDACFSVVIFLRVVQIKDAIVEKISRSLKTSSKMPRTICSSDSVAPLHHLIWHLTKY